jgi:hypothetical protein
LHVYLCNPARPKQNPRPRARQDCCPHPPGLRSNHRSTSPRVGLAASSSSAAGAGQQTQGHRGTGAGRRNGGRCGGGDPAQELLRRAGDLLPLRGAPRREAAAAAARRAHRHRHRPVPHRHRAPRRRRHLARANRYATPRPRPSPSVFLLLVLQPPTVVPFPPRHATPRAPVSGSSLAPTSSPPETRPDRRTWTTAT